LRKHRMKHGQWLMVNASSTIHPLRGRPRRTSSLTTRHSSLATRHSSLSTRHPSLATRHPPSTLSEDVLAVHALPALRGRQRHPLASSMARISLRAVRALRFNAAVRRARRRGQCWEQCAASYWHGSTWCSRSNVPMSCANFSTFGLDF
jgi:hypothetical protein